MPVTKHEYTPEWAPHIKGWYEDRGRDEDGVREEAPVGATCSVCNTSFKRMCSSGLMRTHIANFAKAHLHRDPLKDPFPKAKS